ncbi:peptidoglycan-associated lipoprotein Pal [Sphingomonas sp. ID1715]|uniref:peptidoglycan-associated lipoprotein Pal n=1 Tax=Sphingomonas sp. ID1715 TaxID=1656898 RepID=UPI0014887902|nr:peptidoglycan-associated lipoprotein Pal [Sphingomonas sp. ID1715]NNM77204.1 peptidoglycan-associated lipoprotein Pal [Sphingomonas sp. ID1715]
MRLGHSLMIATALVAVAGCAKKPPKELPPAPVETPAAEVAPTDPNAGAPQPGSQAHFVANVSSDRIFFDTDQSEVDAEDQATLQSQATYLKQYPQVRVTIEGHADERGTREYNLALGERRANAAKNYLASLGIDAGRISTISYGKERPEATGSDEQSWARNRRAVTVTVQ